MTRKKRVFFITTLFYILYILFPLFADVLRIPVWLPSIAVMIVMLTLYPQAFSNKTVYWFLVYAFMLFLYVLVGNGIEVGIGSISDSRKLIIELAFIIPTLCIFSILYYLNDEELNNKIIRWTIIILYASFIVAIPLMRSYNSLRNALMEQNSEESLNIPGLPGYSLMHAYTLFLPVLCYCFKSFKGRELILSLVGLAVLCFVIYDTFITTSLVIMIVIVLFSLLYNGNNMTSLYVSFGLIAILVFVLYKSGILIGIIDWMSPAFEGTPVAPKLEDFRASMTGGNAGGSITDRQDFHGISWDSFLENPLFGGGHIGGHSTLLDRLGGMGLVVAFPYLMIFISAINRIKPSFRTKKTKTFFWVGILVGFIYLYNKGNWGCESWLIFLVLMPLGIQVFEKKILSTEHKAE